MSLRTLARSGLFSGSLAFALLGACSASSHHGPASGPTPPTPVDPAGSPVASGAMLGADGQHFAVERVYEGDCSPAGSRGGCHTMTLRPDGTYTNFLYDAGITGTYTVTGANVVFQATGAGTETKVLSPDGTKLDTLALKP